MKKHFKKELVINKQDEEDFKNPTKCWICDSVCVDNDVKVRDECHITGKYKASEHRDCSMNVKLNHKIPALFHNLRSYNSHLITQKLAKFKLEKFKEQLPSKEKFPSWLTGKISCKKYENVLKLWNKFKMKTMKDYHDFYSKCDVLLLVDNIHVVI